MHLPNLEKPPQDMLDLMLGVGPVPNQFRKDIRCYNNAFAMASMEAEVHLPAHGIYGFKISGQPYRRTGALTRGKVVMTFMPRGGCGGVE